MVAQQPLTIASGDLKLEGVYYTPDGAAPGRAVVVCHPHPQYGGDMHNLVVTVIVRGLIEAGIAALAFNFRGVGASEGYFDNGAGEQDDVHAVLAHARGLAGVTRVGLAGYSFGAGMAAAAVDASVAALALVALPPGMARREGSGLLTYAGPLLAVSGGNDNISPEAGLRALLANLPSKQTITIVPGADHFWWGQERPLADAVRDFFASNL